MRSCSPLLLKEWNFGVTQDNFVRLTLQRACYEANKNKKMKDGFPLQLVIPGQKSSGTLSCFWVSILPMIWPEIIGGFQA